MISGSHGDECEDGCVLGCSALQIGVCLPTFRRYEFPLKKLKDYFNQPDEYQACAMRNS
jgi:hypothetical protein